MQRRKTMAQILDEVGSGFDGTLAKRNPVRASKLSGHLGKGSKPPKRDRKRHAIIAMINRAEREGTQPVTVVATPTAGGASRHMDRRRVTWKGRRSGGYRRKTG